SSKMRPGPRSAVSWASAPRAAKTACWRGQVGMAATAVRPRRGGQPAPGRRGARRPRRRARRRRRLRARPQARAGGGRRSGRTGGRRGGAERGGRWDGWRRVWRWFSQRALLAEAREVGAAWAVEHGDDLVDAGVLAEAHGGRDAGAVADRDPVGEAAGDLIVPETLVAGDGAHVRPQLGHCLPGERCTAAAVGRADGLLQGEAVAEGGDVHGEMVSGEMVSGEMVSGEMVSGEMVSGEWRQ